MTFPFRRFGWACAVVAVLATTFSSSAAVSGAAQSVVQARTAAEIALLSGRYDEVEPLTASHASDEALVVLRARALIARGEYAAAERVLTPAAAAAPAGDAALELGLLQLALGRRSEGRRAMQLLLMAEVRSPTARDYARAARAARALGQFPEANGYFREAIALAPADAVIDTYWGELFLEKHQWGEAAKSFQAALKNQPDYGPAHLGMARAVVNENPPAAERFARRALELNPSEVRAHVFLAELATLDDQKPDARAAIDKALAINPHSLEALAMSAALHYVEGHDAEYKQAITAALELNPLYGEAFRVVGEITARYYRFDEAAEQARRAIAIDRENPRAQADLGLYLMRTGDERNARRALETSFRVDPYDVITYNLLEVLDLLDTFEVITDSELIVKLDPAEAGVMREYVPTLAKEALQTLSKRWNFTPQGPILVEMFPLHDHFAVRTVGLEGMIGALGACFGRVVTMDSPKARPPGDFSWAATLWHEIAHVITLQLSNQRIPRWLSEGISEYEETRARPEWFRNMTVPFVRAMDAGEVIKLRDLNSGFQDPRTISLAYYQASVLVEHIVERFGQDALRAFVASFAEGIDTEAAITRVFKTDIDALQASFDAYIAERFGPLQRALAAPEGVEPELPLEKLTAAVAEHPDSYVAHMVLGRALRSSDPDGAIQAFERAARLVPMMTGPESAYMQIVEISMARGDKERAAQALEAMLVYEHTAIDAARRLVALLDGTDDQPRVRRALQRVVAIDPFDAPSHTALGRMALGSGETAEAVRNFRVALAAGPINRASAHADLAEGLLQAGNRAEAKREALAALEIAPTYERAQDLLLKLSDGPR
ncbi:MAG TPA: tetratricopeptide repeat protein [Vicinamibacterales bacterium]|nr:tetratricopeptide repeat protein [Vicinamibacterales bacterium]